MGGPGYNSGAPCASVGGAYGGCGKRYCPSGYMNEYGWPACATPGACGDAPPGPAAAAAAAAATADGGPACIIIDGCGCGMRGDLPLDGGRGGGMALGDAAAACGDGDDICDIAGDRPGAAAYGAAAAMGKNGGGPIGVPSLKNGAGIGIGGLVTIAWPSAMS